MQLPELFRRGIVSPLDEETADQLRRWDIATRVQVDFLPIVSDSLFEQLWQSGAFQKMNRACESLIDDYEEEVLTPDQLSAALTAVAATGAECKVDAVRVFLSDLNAVIASAKTRNQSVYFIL